MAVPWFLDLHLRAQIRVQDVYGNFFLRNHVWNSCFTKRKLRSACFIYVFRTPLRICKNTAFSFYVKSTQFTLDFFGFTYLKWSYLSHLPKFVVTFPLHIQFHGFKHFSRFWITALSSFSRFCWEFCVLVLLWLLTLRGYHVKTTTEATSMRPDVLRESNLSPEQKGVLQHVSIYTAYW